MIENVCAKLFLPFPSEKITAAIRSLLMNMTIKDVASKAGVSVTTVSHVINKTRFVSEELVERVLAAMQELNYHPNTLARSLRMGETKTIGLIIPDNSNPFFAEISRTVEDIGFERGYSVFLCNSDGLVEKEAAYINMLITKQVDGVVYIPASDSQNHLLGLSARGIPVVVVDRDMPYLDADVVLIDNEQGGYDATRYLLELGHKKIACITGPSQLTPSAARVEGYQRALQEASQPVRSEYILPGDFRARGGETAMNNLLKLPETPTAVFSCNDMMAIGALRALRKNNIKVPQQISIIGFDDIDIAAEIVPALTTVAQPAVDLATCAADLLIARLKKDQAPTEYKRRVLDARLVIRDSCAPSLET
jgi:LacI family transcriptional regulator